MNQFIKKFAQVLGAVVGATLFMLLACAAVGVAGLSVGRLAEVLMGQYPRGLVETFLDGSAIIVGIYLLLWLPASALLERWRAPPDTDV
tara:strand:- start:134 stop:400 length:267 start_codon:yes stop_codon:yes gene_type:complete